MPDRLHVFLALAFGLAWIPAIGGWLLSGRVDPPMLSFAGFAVSPGLAALAAAWTSDEKRPRVRALLGTTRNSPRALGLIAMGVLWYVSITQAMTAALDPDGAAWPDATAWVGALGTVPLIAFSAVAEELGWRGLLLRSLQTRWPEFEASIAVGAIWGVWHLPLALQSGTPNAVLPIWWYPAAAVTMSIIYTAVFNTTAGSVVAVAALHGTMNLLTGPFVQNRFDNGHSLTLPSAASITVNVLLAAGVIAGTRTRRQAPSVAE